MDVHAYVTSLGQAARAASRHIAQASTATKNKALLGIATAIRREAAALLAANAHDMATAQQAGLDDALLDRLTLTPHTLAQMADGCEQIATLPDPIGNIRDMNYRPSGIRVGRMRVPLGVIGIIYEARPNVTIDAAALCLKSGNAAILRGGKEAAACNQLLAQCVQTGLAQAGLPQAVIQVIDTTDRAAVGALITATQYVDIIIPRGGKGLIQRITEEAKIPVIKHLDGICHVYIDDDADVEMAIRIADNAKTHRYGTCNTMETLLIAHHIAPQVLPQLIALFQQKNVELRGCKTSCAFSPTIIPATEQDWHTEYLAPILSIRIVSGLEQAIEHINHYGSHHTDTIVTNRYDKAMLFLKAVDSASVMVNASTRFADGFEFGLGAEIGISTDKLHARGPVGLEGLTSEKWVVLGEGHIRG